jgi:hypothetical protein
MVGKRLNFSSFEAWGKKRNGNRLTTSWIFIPVEMYEIQPDRTGEPIRLNFTAARFFDLSG